MKFEFSARVTKISRKYKGDNYVDYPNSRVLSNILFSYYS